MVKRHPNWLKIGLQAGFGPNFTVEFVPVFQKKFGQAYLSVLAGLVERRLCYGKIGVCLFRPHGWSIWHSRMILLISNVCPETSNFKQDGKELC